MIGLTATSPVALTTVASQKPVLARSLVASSRLQLLPNRSLRTVVRAETGEKPISQQAEEAFNKQAKQVDDQITQPLSQGKPATDPNNAWDESIKEAGKAETEKLGTKISIPDALRFRAVGPEHINSRLAMIGVTTGYLTKLITGRNTLEQYIAAPFPVILTFIVFIAASLIPITKGVTPEKAENGIWTAKAEIYNGRLAMIGFISLLATDGWQWFSALQAAKGANLS